MPAKFLSILSALCALFAASCTTFDKEAEKPLASLETNLPAADLRPALVEVFGRRGLACAAPGANPMFFEGKANRAELFAYKDFGEYDQVIVERAHIDLVPTAAGIRMQARVQIISNPGTLFEDAKFPIVGMRARYKKMLENAAAIAGGRPVSFAPEEPPRKASPSYEVPLPLENL